MSKFTLEKGVKCVQSYQWRHQNNVNDVNDVVLVTLMLTLNIFHTFFSASIVDFEHVNVCWERLKEKRFPFSKIVCVTVWLVFESFKRITIKLGMNYQEHMFTAPRSVI